MPNIASVLKSEIARIARKEIRGEVDSLKKAVGTYRSEIAALKRRSQTLEQQLRKVGKAIPAPKATSDDGSSKTLRFSANGLKSHRERLSLSAHDCGVLIGASGQSIYNWEAGTARPRAKHLEAIAALKTLGKKQAASIIASRTTTTT